MATRISGLEFADWVNRRGKQMGFAQDPTLSYLIEKNYTDRA